MVTLFLLGACDTKEYRNPMLAFCRETKVLPESVVHKIFSNIDIIAELHCILLEQLKERMKTWSPTATQVCKQGHVMAYLHDHR